LLLLFAQSAAADRALSVCHEVENLKPWFDTAGGGLAIELINEALKATGVRVLWTKSSLENCLLRLESGSIDAIPIGFKYTHMDRGGFFPLDAQSKPNSEFSLFDDKVLIYKKPGSTAEITGFKFQNLKGKIVIPRHKWFNVPFDVNGETKIKPIEARTEDFVQKFLQDPQGEVMIISKVEADSLTKELFKKLTPMKSPNMTRPYYLMFSRAFCESQVGVCDKVWKKILELKKQNRGPSISLKF
jgi:polar amino acid transport system substrate-binding protein